MGHNLIKVMQRNIEPIRAAFADHPDPEMVQTVKAVDALAARGRALRLRDVDEHLTCRLGGLRKETGGVFPFKGADGYYEWASSKRFIPQVRRWVGRGAARKCLKLMEGCADHSSGSMPLMIPSSMEVRGVLIFESCAHDVRPASLPLDLVAQSSHVVLAVTGGGGHLGWFDGPLFASRRAYPQQRWVLQPVKEYVNAAVEDGRLDTQAARRSTQSGEDGWTWVEDRASDLYGRIGWKVVESHGRVQGQDGSGALQGL